MYRINVWVSPEEREAIRDAFLKRGEPVAGAVRRWLFAEAGLPERDEPEGEE